MQIAIYSADSGAKKILHIYSVNEYVESAFNLFEIRKFDPDTKEYHINLENVRKLPEFIL